MAKLNYEGTIQYHQAGLMVYGDDDNYTKFDRLATNANGNGDEKFEFINEVAGTPRNEAADATANLPAGFPKDYWVRLESDGTNMTGAYSTDGTTWTTVGRPAPLPANAKVGLFALSNSGTGNAGRQVRLVHAERRGHGRRRRHAVRPELRRQFDGSSLDKTAGTRSSARTPRSRTSRAGS